MSTFPALLAAGLMEVRVALLVTFTVLDRVATNFTLTPALKLPPVTVTVGAVLPQPLLPPQAGRARLSRTSADHLCPFMRTFRT
ncbi:hypothetical protein [Deinococcus sp.]|uniref:hypothetical protein n=1 Tax=Deinococcus sp. TaxID=47478 RepID=UPI003C79F139